MTLSESVEAADRVGNLIGQIRIAVTIQDVPHALKCVDEAAELIHGIIECVDTESTRVGA